MQDGRKKEMTEVDKDIREKKQIGNSARHKVVSGGRRA
jgi:hypothetical protein